MSTKIIASAFLGAALMAASKQVPAEIFGENDYQVTSGQVKIISRWRATFSTNPWGDADL